MTDTNPKACPESDRHPDGTPAFDFRRLSDLGVLWLINRVVFHPRGFALSLLYADGVDEPYGWSIVGDGSEVWTFEGFDEDAKLREVEALLSQAREFGVAPHVGPAGSDHG